MPRAIRARRNASSVADDWKARIARRPGDPAIDRAQVRAARRCGIDVSISTSGGVNHPVRSYTCRCEPISRLSRRRAQKANPTAAMKIGTCTRT